MSEHNLPPTLPRKREREEDIFSDAAWISDFKLLLSDHLKEYSIPGTEHMSLLDACRIVTKRYGVDNHSPMYKQWALDHHAHRVAAAMEELRLEAKKTSSNIAGAACAIHFLCASHPPEIGLAVPGGTPDKESCHGRPDTTCPSS